MRVVRAQDVVHHLRPGSSMLTAVALVVSGLAVVVGGPTPIVDAVRTPTPVVSYDFSDGQGATVADGSGPVNPLDLTISDPANVTWVPGGLRVDAPTTISSGGGAAKVADAVQASGAITIEAWIVAATGAGIAPASVVANDSVTGSNFVVAQGTDGGPTDAYALRTRTSTSIDGSPELVTPSGSAAPQAFTHVVSTRTTDGVRTTYIDGESMATDTLAGDLANWDDTFDLTIANDAEGLSPWLGTLCRVAIYDTALDPTEVKNNFEAGCDLQTAPPEATVEVTPGGGVDATTDGGSTLTVSNTTLAGAPMITRVEFDVTGSMIPDSTFDSLGAAGDEATQCLEVGDEGGTGYVVPVDNCADPFSVPHEDSPESVGNGSDVVVLDFVDFGPGESISFGVERRPDHDPGGRRRLRCRCRVGSRTRRLEGDGLVRRRNDLHEPALRRWFAWREPGCREPARRSVGARGHRDAGCAHRSDGVPQQLGGRNGGRHRAADDPGVRTGWSNSHVAAGIWRSLESHAVRCGPVRVRRLRGGQLPPECRHPGGGFRRHRRVDRRCIGPPSLRCRDRRRPGRSGEPEAHHRG